jgi:hypothetical protein
MSDQTTLRLPEDLARRLDKRARSLGVPKSQVVREALAQYLAEPMDTRPPMTVRERSAPYIGALRLDQRKIKADPAARLIRERNWR